MSIRQHSRISELIIAFEQGVKAEKLVVFVENHHMVLKRMMVGLEVEWIRVENRDRGNKRKRKEK